MRASKTEVDLTNLAVPWSNRESGFAYTLLTTASSKSPAVGMPNHTNEECRAVQVARAFFQAATKLSDDNEDILPQVCG